MLCECVSCVLCRFLSISIMYFSVKKLVARSARAACCFECTNMLLSVNIDVPKIYRNFTYL